MKDDEIVTVISETN